MQYMTIDERELSMRPRPLHTPLLDREYSLDHNNKQKEENQTKTVGQIQVLRK